jgi:hypothetical protein
LAEQIVQVAFMIRALEKRVKSASQYIGSGASIIGQVSRGAASVLG